MQDGYGAKCCAVEVALIGTPMGPRLEPRTQVSRGCSTSRPPSSHRAAKIPRDLLHTSRSIDKRLAFTLALLIILTRKRLLLLRMSSVFLASLPAMAFHCPVKSPFDCVLLGKLNYATRSTCSNHLIISGEFFCSMNTKRPRRHSVPGRHRHWAGAEAQHRRVPRRQVRPCGGEGGLPPRGALPHPRQHPRRPHRTLQLCLVTLSITFHLVSPSSVSEIWILPP
jgi:hypothetical protein